MRKNLLNVVSANSVFWLHIKIISVSKNVFLRFLSNLILAGYYYNILIFSKHISIYRENDNELFIILVPKVL